MTDSRAGNVPGRSEGSVEVNLDEVLVISGASDLQDLLREAVEDGAVVVLDGSRVAQVDTSALQILSAFVRDADTLGFSVEWKAPSEALRFSAGLLGLTEGLSLPAAAETEVTEA